MKKHPYLMLRAMLAALALLCSVSVPAARHALLIGISDYQGSGLNALPGAGNDITLMQDVLKSRLGFLPAEITTLRDKEATHTGIQHAFAALAEAVQPGDFVYIHYSGHGSLVKDFNDSERGGWDQTLVGWGARRPDSSGLDRFDILDDELNRWLAPIARTAGELVFVADSCHSATNTRGEHAPVDRAAPADSQTDHPHARDRGERDPLTEAIRIGAAADDQSAYEMTLDDGSKSGVFSWHWARALHRAEPTDTWRRVFDRTAAGIALAQGTAQRPQLTGAAVDRRLLGGALDPRPTVLVTEVDGDMATLNAGRLAGVTVGSLYGAGDAEDVPLVRISHSSATWSRGRIERGVLAEGAFLTEREHAYETGPLALFVLPAEHPDDQALVEQLRQRLRQLAGYAWTDVQSEADLVLTVLRPHRIDGTPHHRTTAQGRDTLPAMDPAATPEVWVLTPGEALLHEGLVTPLASVAEGLELLARNLERYRRATELRRLTADAGASVGLKLHLIPFETCAPEQPGCFLLSATGSWHRRGQDTLPIQQLGTRNWPDGTLLSFALENTGLRNRYAYLFELAPNGAIRPVFPTSDMGADVARIRIGERLDLTHPDIDRALLLDTPGDLSLLVLTTRFPIDPRLLEQGGYERSGKAARSGTRGLNPLEQLLATAIHGNGTRTGISIGTGSWGGTLIDYHVERTTD